MRKIAAGAVGLALLAGIAPGVTPARADASDLGVWSAPFREDGFDGSRDANGCVTNPDGTQDCLPVGASIVTLANGKVLYWNALENFEEIEYSTVAEVGHYGVDDQSRVLTIDPDDPADSTWATPSPSTGAATNADPEPLITPIDDPRVGDSSLFCTDQKLLFDGRVITVGGTDYYHDPGVPGTQFGVSELEGTKSTRLYDPVDNKWSLGDDMNYGRWYPSMVTFGDGKLFVASGVTRLIKPVYTDRLEDSGTNVKQSETYDPETDQWTVNEGGEKSLPLFPRLHLLPNGKVFYAAAGQAFNPSGQSYDEALWNFASVYDPNAQGAKWRDLGIPGLNTTAPGFRGSTFNAMLPLKPPYDKAAFLTAGGVLGVTPGSYVATDDSRIDVVDLSGGEETMESFQTGPLNQRRWYSTGVNLPDGTVMAFSGGDLDGVVGPGGESPIRQAELFVPDADGTGGTWKKMASATQPRTYHNNAVLLPDGRVLVGGNAPIPNSYTYKQNNPSTPAREFANNFHDPSFEIFTPPYALRTDRPEFLGAPVTINRGSTIDIQVSDTEQIESVVLVRNTAQTHLIDGDQRTVELPIVDRQGSNSKVAVTDNANVLPPGPYLIFANKRAADGTLVPSVGWQTSIDDDAVLAAPPVETAATTASATTPAAGLVDQITQAHAATPAVVAAAEKGFGLTGTPVANRRSGSPVDGLAAAVAGTAVAIGLAGGTWVTRRRRRVPVER